MTIISRFLRYILASFYIFTLFLLFFHPIDSGDFFHNANIGQYVVANFAIPHRDTLSFTAYGQTFVPYGWGIGVIFYLVMTLLGANGVSILFGFLGLTASILLYKTLRNLKINTLSSLVFVFLASSMVSLRFPTRQEFLGPLFLIALVWLLSIWNRQSAKSEMPKLQGGPETLRSSSGQASFHSDASERAGRLKLIFPLFFWLWGIMYASSAFVGIGLFAWYLITAKIVPRSGIPLRGTSQKENVRKEDGRNILIFFLSFIAAALLNGSGLAGFFFIQNIPEMLWHNGEWGSILNLISPNIPGITISIQYTFLVLVLFTILTVSLMLFTLFNLRKIVNNSAIKPLQGNNVLFFLSLAFFVFTPYIATRFLDTAPLLAMPAVALMTSFLNRKFQKIILIICVLLALLASYIRFSDFHTGGGIEDGVFPGKVVQFLKTHEIYGNIYSIQEIGAYLSWEMPQSKVYVDTRDELYVTVFRELKPVFEGAASLIPLLDKYHANILIGGMSELSMYKDLFYLNDWKLVYLSDGNFVFVRKELADAKHLATFDAIDLTRNPPVKAGQLTTGEEELKTLLALDPGSVDNNVRLAELYLSENKGELAKKIIERQNFTFDGSLRVDTEIQTRELQGQMYLETHDCSKAFTALTRANALSYGQMIFFPSVRLGTVVDKYLGEYYQTCDNNPALAREYYERYLPQVADPLEQMDIEQRIEKLGN